MSEVTDMPKYIVSPLDGDTDFPIITVFGSWQDIGPAITTAIGAGNPFYGFTSLPMALLTADELGANFTGAPLAADPADPNYAQTNRDAFDAQVANPVPTGETNDGINKVWKVA